MFWMSTNLQNGMSSFMKNLDWLHSYTLIFLLMILVMVMLIVFFIIWSKFIFFFQNEMQVIEFLWTLAPSGILIFLGIPSLNLLYNSESTDLSPFLSVKVEAHQWYWSYSLSDFENYSFDSFMVPISNLMEGSYRLLEVDNRLILPMQMIIRFIISSADVLHSWAIPPMGVKIDANPGRLNQICLNSLMPQVVHGQCSEICGANHSFMPIVIEFCPLSSFKSFINLL